jgi:dihydrofolate reductase
MGKLICSALASLDGYVADADGNFDWAAPDEEVHAFVNDLTRGIGTYLFGRKMYEVLVAWETMSVEGEPAVIRDYAEIWRAADKIVYSSTLQEPSSARTRIERAFDPDAVRRMKAELDRDLSVGGPHLAAEALRAALVDELHLFVAPVVVGGGTGWLPDGIRLDLELLDERRFTNGTVYARYRTTRDRLQ